MEYQLGFEIIGEDLNPDKLQEIILGGVKREEVVKIEQSFVQLKSQNQIDSYEQLAEGIARLKSSKSSKPRQECWRIYLEIDESEDYRSKESYWLELILEKLQIIARPLTDIELSYANLVAENKSLVMISGMNIGKFNHQGLIKNYAQKYSTVPIEAGISLLEQKQKLKDKIKSIKYNSSIRRWRRNRREYKQQLNYFRLLMREMDYQEFWDLGLMNS